MRLVQFRLKLVYADGTDITFDAASTFERDLITAVTAAAVKHGVGLFRTEAQVAAAIEAGFVEVLTDLKQSSTRLLR